jgi:hypothetical protein
MTNTAGIMYLAKNARGRNRSIDEEGFSETVDPVGRHVLALQFPHNDIEMRTQWVCKMKNTNTPQEIWLDVDLDAFEECTTTLEMPDDGA